MSRDKDLNINVKMPGAEQAKQQAKGLANATKEVGEKTASGQRQAAGATKQSNDQLTGMGRVLGNLKSQVMSFVGGWLGLHAVIKLLDVMKSKLESIEQAQEKIYNNSLSLAEVGQGLEFQTGTVGQQQYWAKQALGVQQAGGLQNPEAAQQMLVSMDIAFAKQGGIKNQQIVELGKQLAPFFGTAGLSGEEIAKVFEFAGTAGIDPATEAYTNYFAKLQAGYTASKATNFGQFMTGLQKGGTSYMAMGGSLEEAISTFSGARSVMANEALAATLLEQTARLSSGAYEKPRKAIERARGVSWEDLTMDKRTAALLEYVESIEEGKRSEVLASQGFPVELTTQLGKMVSPEAKQTMAATRQQVAAANPESVRSQTNAFMKSMAAKKRQGDAERRMVDIEKAPEYASWREALETAKSRFDALEAEGEDKPWWLMSDATETQYLAFEELLKDVESLEKDAVTGEHKKRIEDMKAFIHLNMMGLQGSPKTSRILKSVVHKRGKLASKKVWELEADMVAQGPPVIINDHSINYYPRVGDDQRGPRFTRD